MEQVSVVDFGSHWYIISTDSPGKGFQWVWEARYNVCNLHSLSMLADWFLCWQLALHVLDSQGKNWGNKPPRHQLSSLIYSKGNSFRVPLGLGWNLTVSPRLGRVPASKKASNKFLLSKCLVLKPVYLLCMWLPALGLVYILRAVCWHQQLPTWTENQ